MNIKRFIFGLSILSLLVVSNVSANMVLDVRHKFAGQQPSLSAMKEHDSHRFRHRRVLYGVDFPLEGNGLANSTGLYFTQFGIGTPEKTYYVQVDTGSDVLWVNCAGCTNCPKSTSLAYLGVKLQLYDPTASSTAQNITCQQEFCTVALSGNTGCSSNSACYYEMEYGDGSTTGGYFVSDVIQYNEVLAGNNKTSLANTTIAFGCAVQRTGNLASTEGALDGILGMGPASTSLVSQLAASGVVQDTFAHCLADSVSGGGIFVIGEVLQPKVNTTPLVSNQDLYAVNLESVKVGGTVLQIPASAFNSSQETIVDSGTTLAYFTDAIYQPLMTAIMAQYPNLVNQLPCFEYTGSVDSGFPNVTFTFQNSVPMVVYPHEYMLYQGGQWCILWQDSSSLTTSTGSLNILGDVVISNKLVVYDLQNKTIGWTEYNCSASIELQTDPSGTTSQLDPLLFATPTSSSNTSSAWSLDVERFITFVLLTVALHFLIN